MLEQISYIDDCDTLGQKANKKDIYKVIHSKLFEAFLFFPQALVSVYQKILEFYKVSDENNLGERPSSKHCPRLLETR